MANPLHRITKEVTIYEQHFWRGVGGGEVLIPKTLKDTSINVSGRPTVCLRS